MRARPVAQRAAAAPLPGAAGPSERHCQVDGVGGTRSLQDGVNQHGFVDATPSSYRGHRLPVEIISHCVWLYHRFPLSLRDVQEVMAERGVIVSYESIHQWCRKFGQSFANGLRRRRARPGDKWPLDEVFITINGETHSLWRAVDQHGTVVDILR
jgi:DDE domain